MKIYIAINGNSGRITIAGRTASVDYRGGWWVSHDESGTRVARPFRHRDRLGALMVLIANIAAHYRVP